MRRFYRSPEHKIMAGVCGGLAEKYSLNIIMVRIGFVGLLAFSVIPILAIYIVLWIMLPVGPQDTPPSAGED